MKILIPLFTISFSKNKVVTRIFPSKGTQKTETCYKNGNIRPGSSLAILISCCPMSLGLSMTHHILSSNELGPEHDSPYPAVP